MVSYLGLVALFVVVTVAGVDGAVVVPVKMCSDAACSTSCTAVTYYEANDSDGCDGDGEQLVVGDIMFSLTKFNKEDCNRFSDRQVAYGNVGQCVPWGKGQYAIVPSLSSINASTAAVAAASVSYYAGCDGPELFLDQGSCNPRGSASLMPLCVRGRVLVQYFEDTKCTSPSTTSLLQTNNCAKPVLLVSDDLGASKFNCLGYEEATCLSIRGNPWYIVIIAALPLVSAIVLTSVFVKYLIHSCCCRTPQVPNPDAFELRQNPNNTDNNERPLMEDGQPSTMEQPSNALALNEQPPKLAAAERVGPNNSSVKLEVVVIGGSIADEVEISVKEASSMKVAYAPYSTVSEYSTNTMRGMQTLTCFTSLTGGGLIMQAAIQQTLTDSYCRPGWLFVLQCVGYGAIVITGLAPSDHVNGRRAHNAILWFSSSTEKKNACGCGIFRATTTTWLHRVSFFAYILIPPGCMLLGQFWAGRKCYDYIELGFGVAMAVFFAIFMFLWLRKPPTEVAASNTLKRWSFIFEMLTVFSSLLLYMWAETGVMARCAFDP